MKIPLNYKVLFWYALAFSAIVFFGYITLKAYDANLNEYEFRKASSSNIIRILNLEIEIEYAETAQRGYLITGDESFLTVYINSLRSVNNTFNDLKKNIGIGNSALINSLDSLLSLKTSKMNEFINERKNPNHQKSLLLIASDSNRAVMENIKNVLHVFNEIENNKLKIHSDAANDSAKYTKDLLPAGIVLALVFISIGYVIITRDMKAREKAEAETDRIFKLSPDLLSISNTEGRFIKLNPAWEKTLGFSTEELLSQGFIDILHPDDIEKSQKSNLETIEGKDRHLYENRYQAKEGNYKWIQWSSTFDEASGLIYSSGKDITEVREHEKEVRELNERLLASYAETEQIFMLSLDMLSITGFDGYFKKLNPAWEINLGYTIDELVSKPFIYFVHPDDIEKTSLAMQNLALGENVFIENRYKAKDGSYKWMQWAAVPNNETGLIYATAKNITNIKEKEQEVKKLNERLLSSYAETERIFMLSASLMSVTDYDGHFIKVNPAWERVLGYSINKLLTMKFRDLVHPDDIGPTKKVSIDVRKGNDISSFENRFITLDGNYKWLRWFAKAIRDEGLVYATAIDITEEKEREYELRTLNERLYESYKEMESFSYSVSHDLRAPLRHTIGFSQKLKRVSYDKINDEGRRAIDKIITAAEHMSKLIDDLLHFSHIGRSDLTMIPVNMNQFINTIIGELDIPKERNINWKISRLPEVKADPVFLALAINNLLSNAVKYTSKNEVTVIEIKYAEEDFDYVFEIKDNGVGFDMQYADKLFGVFQRLHSSGEFEGTGIGLAIASKVIQKHGGRMWAESEEGKGASFYFTLPKI